MKADKMCKGFVKQIALSVLIMLTLSGCSLMTTVDPDIKDLEKFKESFQILLAEGDTINSITGDIPYTNIAAGLRDEIEVSMVSDKPTVISNSGSIYPSDISDETVKLTFNLKKGKIKDTKTFTVTVLQMAASPVLSEMVGTWKKTTKVTGTDEDENGAEVDYTETTATTLILANDGGYIEKNITSVDYATGATSITYTDFKGLFSSNHEKQETEFLSTELFPFISFTPSHSRESTTAAFEDDAIGWLPPDPAQPFYTSSKTLIMYKGQLCIDLLYRYVAFSYGQLSLSGFGGMWIGHYGLGPLMFKFGADGSYSESFTIGYLNKTITNTGTFIVNGDNTVSTSYIEQSTGKKIDRTLYYRIIQRIGDDSVSYEGLGERTVKTCYAFLYLGLTPFNEGCYSKQ